jgi:hypothetical protein
MVDGSGREDPPAPFAPVLGCPWCWTPLGAGWGHCPTCGVDLTDPDLRRLAELDVELAAIDARRAAMAAERDALVHALRGRLPVAGAPAAPAPPLPPPSALPPPPRPSPPAEPGPEWTAARLGLWLLGLGVVLVTLAGAIFAATQWSVMTDLHRAVVLGLATVLVAALAVALRRRLPVTSEALGLLLIGFALIDWYAVRVGGAGGDLEGAAWWAIGTALGAGLSIAVGVVLDHRPARVAAPVLAWAAVALAVVAVGPAASVGGAALSVAVTATVVALVPLAGLDGWRVPVIVAATVAASVWSVAVVLVLVGFAGEDTGVVADALATSSLVLPMVALRVVVPAVRSNRPLDRLLGASTAVGAAAAVVVLATGRWDGPALLIVIVALGVALVGLGRMVPPRWGTGLVEGAWLVVGAAVLAAVPVAIEVGVGSVTRSAGWWTDELGRTVPGPSTLVADLTVWWLACVAAVGIGLVLAAGAERIPGPGPAARLPAVATGVMAGTGLAMGLVVAPSALALTIGGALALASGVAASAVVLIALVPVAAGDGGTTTRRAVVAAAVVVGSAAAMQAVGWALTDRWTTVALVAVAAIAALVAAVTTSGPAGTVAAASATALALLDAALVPLALDAGPLVAGLTLASAGVLALAAAPWGLRRRPEAAVAVVAVGTVGWIAGVLVAAADPDHAATGAAAAVTLGVPGLAVAGSSAAMPRGVALTSRWGAVGSAVIATWLWLAAYGVDHVEAYTLPAAAVALVAGWTQRRTAGGSHSWIAYGPGLVLAFVPSLVLVIGAGGVVRPVVVLVAAAVAVAVGVLARLQAPVVVGAVTLVVVALDTLAPVVGRLPRWAVVLVVGVACVWAGATFERRLRDVRRGKDALRHLR